MANKKPQNNVKKNMASLNSPWLKNALKSMGVAGTDVIKDLVPATSETIKSSASVINDTVTNLKRQAVSQGRVTKAIKNNPVTRMTGEFFKNAIQDVKSGNLYNEERGSGLGSDDDFGDDIDTLFDDIEEYANANENVSITQNITAPDTKMDASIKAVREQTEYQLKSAQATIDTMASLSSNSLIKMDEIGQNVLSELATINSNLSAMIEYNNTNMTKFIEASIGYYEQMSASIEDDNGSGSSKVTQNDIYGSNGGLNFNSYKEYVKGNIKDMRENSGAAGMLSMLIENKDLLISNPVGMGIKMGMKAAIPDILKASMESFDKSLKNLIPTVLERIGSLGQNDDTAFGGLLRTIGGALGIKTSRKTDFDTSNIKKGPMPYNGVANHTIVEIIPKYLRESNSYLKEIAQSLTGKNDKDLLKSASGFNWETGKFMNVDDIRNELFEQLQTEVTSSFERSSFGKKLQNNGNLLKNQKDQDNYGDALTQLYNAIERHNGELNFNNTDSLNEILGQINSSDNIKNLIKASIQDMKDANDDSWGSAYAAKREATRKKNQLMRTFEDEASENGLRQIGDDLSYDDWAKKKYAGSASVRQGGVRTSSVNMSLPSLVKGIHDILLRGIYVKTTRRLGALPSSVIGSSTTSNNASNNAEISDEPQVNQSYDEFKNQLSEDRTNEDELNATIDSGSRTLRQRAGNVAANKINLFTNVMNGIVNGNADEAWDAFINGIGDTFKRAGDFMKEHFLNPIKETLFGTKNEDGYIEGGLFAGVNNRMKESFYGLRRMITGKGYVDAEGNQVPDANEDEMKNTVAGKLKNMLGTIKDGISLRLFGTKDDEDISEEDKKEGAIGKVKKGLVSAAGSFYNGLVGWKKALFGKDSVDENEDPEKAGKKIFEDIKKKATDVLPSALTGSIVGAGAGMMSGGLLGTLVGGPVGGAILGLAGGIASKSDRFKTWLFGKDEEDGSHTEGLIKKSTQEFFSKNKQFIAGGAALGMAKGAITGGGFLGTLVGGPIAGALLGVGTSMLIKSDTFQKFIFGDEENGQLGMKQHFQRWIGKFGKKVDGTASGGKATGMVGIGALGGGALGMLFGGPVVGSILGLSAGIIAQKDNFHEWLFGKEDEDGNKKEGILGQFKNMLNANVFKPLGNKFKEIGADFKTFLKYDILGRVNLITERVGDAVFGGLSKITGSAMATVGDFGNYLKENFLGNLVEIGRKITAPIASAAGTVAKGVYSAGKKLISMPLTLIDAVTSPIAGAVAKTVGGIAKVAFKTVDTLVAKPIKTLIIKPLGFLVKTTGNLVAAPFKLLANVADKVSFGIEKFSKHVSNFFFQVKEEFKDAIMNSAPVKWIKARAKNVKEFGARVKDTVKEFVSPVTDLAKSAIHEVKTAITKKIKGFFNKLLNALNPMTWIRKGIRGGKKVANFFGAKFNTSDKPKKEGRLARIWRETGEVGYRRDYSNYLTHDEDGNITGRKDSARKAKQRLYANRDNERLDNKRVARENRDRNWNEKRIAKLTNNQRFEDTEENRKLAEIMSGKTVGWKKVDPTITKSEKMQEEQTESQKDIKKNVKNIADFIMGKTKRKNIVNRSTDMEKLGRERGETITNRDQKVRGMMDDSGSYHGKIENTRIKKMQSKVRKNESEARQDLFNENIEQYGFKNGLKANAKYLAGQFKGLRMARHEDGTSDAKPGMAIVGEKGPEAMYSKNSKTGKLVGVGGPEVINLKGGETIIPNNRIQKFADGTSDADSKSSVFTNILKAINSLKDVVKTKLTTISGKITSTKMSTGMATDAQISEPEESEAGLPNFSLKGNINKKALERIKKKSEDAQAEVSKNTGESVHARKVEEKEKEEKEKQQKSVVTNVSALSTTQSDFSSGWNSVFGLKKGVITGLVLLAIPLLIKFLKNFKMPSIAESVKNGLEDLADDYKWTEENGARTNGNTAKEQAKQEIEDIKNGNLLTDVNGDAHHQTDPTMNVLARLAKNFFSRNHIGKFDSKLTKIEKNIFKLAADVGSGVKKGGKWVKDKLVGGARKGGKFISNLVNKSSYERALSKSTKEGYESLLGKSVKYDRNGVTIVSKTDWDKLVKEFPDAAEDLKASRVVVKNDASIASKVKNSKLGQRATKIKNKVKNSKVVEKVKKGKDLAKGAVDAAKTKVKNAKNIVRKSIKTQGAKGDGKLFTKISQMMDDFLEFVSKKFAAKTGKAGAEKGLASIIKNALGAIKTKWASVCEKIATKLGVKGGAAAVSFGISEAVFATIGAVNGVSGTAKLFNVSSDKVDGTMKLIAGIFGALAGTTVGSVVDLVLSIAGDIAGVDFLNSMAVTLYSLAKGPNSEAYKALDKAQNDWHKTYLKDRDKKVKKQYETQKKAGIIGGDVSYNDFVKGVNKGKYKVAYKSFNDWNVEKNKSLGDKTAEFFSGGFKKAKRATKKLLNKFTGYTEKVITDQYGNRYEENPDGTYNVIDPNGNSLGTIAKDALPSNANIEEKKHKGFVGNVKDKITSGWNGFKNGVSDVKANVNKFFNGSYAKVLAHKDGTYYKKEGNTYTHYDADGNVIEKDIDPKKINMKELTQRYEHQDSKFQKGVKSLKRGAAKLGNNIVKGAKSGWNKFTKGVSNVGSNVKNFASNAIQGVKDMASNAKDAILDSKFVKVISGFVSKTVPLVKDYITMKSDSINYNVPEDNPGKPIIDAGSKVIQFLASGPRTIYAGFNAAKTALTTAVKVTKNFASGMISAGKSYLNGDIENMSDQFKDSPIESTVASAIQYPLSAIRNVKEAFKKIQGTVSDSFKFLKKFVPKIASAGKKYISADISSMGDEFKDSPVESTIAKVIQFPLTPIRYVNAGFKKIQSTVSKSFKFLKKFVPKIASAGKKYIDSDISSMGDEFKDSPVESTVAKVVQFPLTPIRYVNAGFKKIQSTVSKTFKYLTKFVPKIASAGKKYIDSDISSMGDEFKDSPVESTVAKVVQFPLTPIRYVKSAFASIKKTVSSLISTGKDIGSKYVEQAKAYISGDVSSISVSVDKGSPFSGVFSVISNVIQAVLTPLRLVGSTFGKIKKTVSGAIDKVKDTAGNVVDGVKEKFSSVKNALSGVADFFSGNGDGPQGGRGNYSSPSRFIQGGRGDEDADTYNGSTYYSQKDPRWASKKYLRSDGRDDGATMEDSGCGPTAMAMALSDIKSGKKVTPTKLAKFAQKTGDRDSTGTNWNFVNKAAFAYGVDSNMQENPSGQYIRESLASGNPVLLSGRDDGSGTSPYTKAGHYVVAVGEDGSGNIIINDPRGKSYSKKMNADMVAEDTGAAWSFSDDNEGGRGIISNIKNRFRGGFGKKKNWLSIVAACKKSIGKQKKGYSRTGYINVTVDGKTINTRRDCSGFVSVCLSFYTGKKILTNSSGFQSDGNVANYMKKAGFKKIKWQGWNKVKAGDILCTGGSHVEISAKSGTKKVYNCGSNSSCNNPGITNSGKSSYNCIWRPKNPGSTGKSAKITTHKYNKNSSTSDFLSTATTAISGLTSALFEGAITGKFNRNWDQVFGLSDDSSSSSGSSSSGGYDYSKEGSSNKALMRVFNDTWKEEMNNQGPGYYSKPLQDGAGWNYGIASMTQKYNMQSFLNYMKKHAPKLRKKLKGSVGTSEFNNSWGKLGKTNKQEFFDLQLKYLLKSKLEPALSTIRSKTGVDLNNGKHTEGLMSMLLSMSNQRPAWTNELWVPYLRSNKKASDASIIKATGGHIASSYNGNYKDQIRGRYKRQTSHSLKMKTPFKYSSSMVGGKGDGPLYDLYDIYEDDVIYNTYKPSSNEDEDIEEYYIDSDNNSSVSIGTPPMPNSSNSSQQTTTGTKSTGLSTFSKLIQQYNAKRGKEAAARQRAIASMNSHNSMINAAKNQPKHTTVTGSNRNSIVDDMKDQFPEFVKFFEKSKAQQEGVTATTNNSTDASLSNKNYYYSYDTDDDGNPIEYSVDKVQTSTQQTSQQTGEAIKYDNSKTASNTGNGGNVEALLNKVIELLGSISKNSDKLQLLDSIQKQGININTTNTTNIPKTITGTPAIQQQSTESNTMSDNEKTARNIAFGL